MTVLAGTPTHRNSVTPEIRLDESATAVIVLQRGCFALQRFFSIELSPQRAFLNETDISHQQAVFVNVILQTKRIFISTNCACKRI